MQAIRFLSLALAVSAAPSNNIAGRSPAPVEKDGRFYINADTSFANHATYTFTNGFPSNDLQIDQYPGGPNVLYSPSNVVVKDGYLQLKMPGGQTKTPYTGAQVLTKISNIKYASVRTTAILANSAGVCNGMYFYRNETQESDIEWLSDAKVSSNGGTRKLWLTNQDANGDGRKSYTAVTPPSDATTAEHEYRLDWTNGLTQFFVDGKQVWQTTGDVPSVPGYWIWNNWSGGDPQWAGGPPAQDAIFKIKKIDMYYNTA